MSLSLIPVKGQEHECVICLDEDPEKHKYAHQAGKEGQKLHVFHLECIQDRLKSLVNLSKGPFRPELECMECRQSMNVIRLYPASTTIQLAAKTFLKHAAVAGFGTISIVMGIAGISELSRSQMDQAGERTKLLQNEYSPLTAVSAATGFSLLQNGGDFAETAIKKVSRNTGCRALKIKIGILSGVGAGLYMLLSSTDRQEAPSALQTSAKAGAVAALISGVTSLLWF